MIIIATLRSYVPADRRRRLALLVGRRRRRPRHPGQENQQKEQEQWEQPVLVEHAERSEIDVVRRLVGKLRLRLDGGRKV